MRFMLSYAFALLFSMFSFQFEELLKHFCKAGLVVMSYLSFCLSGKDSISPPFLEDNFARYNILGWQGFFSQVL